jgi:hypothetical protein
LPFIVGLNKPTDDIAEASAITGPALTVFLDSGLLIQEEEGALKTLPLLNGLQAQIEDKYEHFARRQSKSKGKGKSAMKVVTGSFTEAELKDAEDICAMIESAIRKTILSEVPLCQSLYEKEVDLEKLKLEVKQKVGEQDKDFVHNFLDTQMFATYVQDEYQDVAVFKQPSN